MNRPAEVRGDGDEKHDCFPPDNRGEGVEEVGAIFLFETSRY